MILAYLVCYWNLYSRIDIEMHINANVKIITENYKTVESTHQNTQSSL